MGLSHGITSRSEWHRNGAGFLLINLGAGLLTFLPSWAWASESPEGNSSPPVVRRPSMESYCGIQSLYRALRALGKETNFRDLVRPEYISSKDGSTVADLRKAAKDFGAFVEPLSRMTCAMLRRVNSPVILHVKSNLGSDNYNHWVLFMGVQDGKAMIYDRDQPGAELSIEELAARWDGTGLLVSDSPISKTAIWMLALSRFLLYGGLVAFVAGLLYQVERGWGRTRRSPSLAGSVRNGIGQAIGLFFVALIAGVGYRIGSEAGFLSSPAAIAAIQDTHLGGFLPKVKANEVVQLLDTPGVTVVDARIPDDYKAGHLRGAINIPVSFSHEQYQEAMADVPKGNRILVYSHSSGCAYGAIVSRELIALGYHDILILRGGWVEWEKHHPSLGKSEQQVKGD